MRGPEACTAWCGGVVAACGMLAALAAAWPLLADQPVHRTAQGVAVAIPAIGDLDCLHMRSVLEAIDMSGYRGVQPEPHDPADSVLLEYENRLSAHFYATCVRALTNSLHSSTAFTHGFGPEGRE